MEPKFNTDTYMLPADNGELPPSAASAGYARPQTRGELRDLLLAGVPCEVVSMVAEITVIMLEGWLGVENIKVRPSRNEGWSIFEA